MHTHVQCKIEDNPNSSNFGCRYFALSVVDPNITSLQIRVLAADPNQMPHFKFTEFLRPGLPVELYTSAGPAITLAATTTSESINLQKPQLHFAKFIQKKLLRSADYVFIAY
jgi:hypothetical protein